MLLRFRQQSKDAWKAFVDGIQQNPLWVAGATGVATVVVVVVFRFYRRGGLGFADKTFWHWLELILVPAAIALGILLLNSLEKRRDRRIRIEADRRDALERYYDRMKDLILNHGLLTSAKGDPARVLAQALTYATVRELDGNRKGDVLRFLHNAQLIRRGDSKVSLVSANFSNAVLVNTNLENAELSLCHFRGADFRRARLKGANLYAADMGRANMSNACLEDAVLAHANFDDADLQGTQFDGAQVFRTGFYRATLSGAFFGGSKTILVLNGTELTKRDAEVHEANFMEANLSGVHISSGQLDECSLLGAIMPDGQPYESWLANQPTEVQAARKQIDQVSADRVAEWREFKNKEASIAARAF